MQDFLSGLHKPLKPYETIPKIPHSHRGLRAGFLAAPGKGFVHILDLRSRDEYVIKVWFIDTRTVERREMKFMDYTFKRKP